MTYPWQHAQWQQLMQRKDRLPHALLLLGIKGIGKTHFAECFVRAKLCQSNNHRQNCECHSCRLITGKSHQDVLWIAPEKPGSAIKIDQIRNIAEFIYQTSLQGEYRFVVIENAGSMNINAANALLKTLEEPAKGAMLILIAEQASHLPATIVSRCQHLHFPRPATDVAREWLLKNNTNPDLILRLAHGAPLAALEWMQDDKLTTRMNVLQSLCHKQMDPLKISADLEIPTVLDIMLTVVMDLLRLRFSADDIINQDFLPQLVELQQRLSVEKITQFMNFLLSLSAQQKKGINFNKQLMMENIFIRWMECA